jgi:hypothetical protein
MITRPVGAELLYADGRTDERTEMTQLIVAFRNFEKAPTKRQCSISGLLSRRRLFSWLCGPTRAMASSFTRVLDHTQQRATVGRTALDE